MTIDRIALAVIDALEKAASALDEKRNIHAHRVGKKWWDGYLCGLEDGADMLRAMKKKS